MRRLFLALLALAGENRPLWAQSSDALAAQTARPVFSIGQPRRWLPFASTSAILGGGLGVGADALIGVQRPILNPITGLLSVSGEALGEWHQTHSTAGVRFLANVPALGLGLGADWRPRTGDIATILTFQAAIRRGGLLGHGSTVRFDWLPARHQTFGLGLQLPLLQPFAGRTRPGRTVAEITTTPSAIRAGLGASASADVAGSAFTTLGDAAALISTYTSLYTEADLAALDAASSRPYGRGYEAATQAYHAALATAFRITAGDSTRGDSIAAQARRIVLDDVILPYDALYGQIKADGDVDVLFGVARGEFSRWLSDSSAVQPDARQRVMMVYNRWLNVLGEVHRRSLDQWKDSRLVWLAPQLALSPEHYDTQADVDTLIGRAVGHPFTNGNAFGYLRTADLPLEMARSIIAARKYHVLWTHDFTGRRPAGELDEVAYTMVADAYLPALTAAVQRYDSAGIMPQYVILLDAFYYHGREGGLWMSILENPLRASVRLRASEGRQATHLRERLEALRAAVGRSTRLQREATAHGGQRWLEQVVKVHVNVVLPSDFSFRSGRFIPPLPFISDNVSRDHRKLVLYDVTETDPYAGELLATGIGIGEHYASATWEDRGYRVRGPVTLEARAAVRRMLMANGFRPDQIPASLRATSGPVIAPVRPFGVARALSVHNEPGFGAKQSSVARAMLYSLAPPGSLIIVPDPLWLSDRWAAMLAGAAARGCTVVIIAPAKANAPSPEPPVIALERDVLRRLLAIRERLAALPNESVGNLRVGVYTSRTPVTDVSRRQAEVRAGLARAPWIRELIPFDATALAVLDRATAQAGPSNAAATSIAQDEVPRASQLHQKTQIIARPGAIAALLRQPGWENVLAQTMRDQAQQTARLADAIGVPTPPTDTAAARAADARLQGYERSLSDADRKRLSFYFSVGSQNHDARGLMLDGEASVIVSGFDGSVGLVDLFYLMARSTWLDSEAQVDQFVPAPSHFMARLARVVRFVM